MELMWKNLKPDLEFAYIRDLGCSRFWIKITEGKIYYLQIEHGSLVHWNKKIHNPIRHALWYGIERYKNEFSKTDTFPSRPDRTGTIKQVQLDLLLVRYAIQYIQN